MSTPIFITTMSFIFAAAVTLGLGIFVLAKGPRKTTNRWFFAFSISVTIFEVAHLLGINQTDPRLAQLAFMFTSFNVFMPVLNAHWTFALAGILQRERRTLNLFYAISAILFTI